MNDSEKEQIRKDFKNQAEWTIKKDFLENLRRKICLAEERNEKDEIRKLTKQYLEALKQ